MTTILSKKITATGSIDIAPMNQNEQREMWKRYGKMQSPLASMIEGNPVQ